MKSGVDERDRIPLHALVVELRAASENEVMNFRAHQLMRQSADGIEFLIAHCAELRATMALSTREHIAHIERVETLVAKITAEVEAIRSKPC